MIERITLQVGSDRKTNVQVLKYPSYPLHCRTLSCVISWESSEKTWYIGLQLIVTTKP